MIFNIFSNRIDRSISITKILNYKVSRIFSNALTISRGNRKRNPMFQNISATALVFYGRKQFVEILNCYLEQNLIDNGGLLTEVIFNAKTNDTSDLEYLDRLIASHPGRYFRKNITNLKWTFETHYQSLDSERYYFKIDDDIVYIHPNAFELMLEAKLMYSDVAFVSANIINHPVLASVHAQMRAISNISALANISGEDPYCGWNSSHCGAVQHESFIKRLNENSLKFYIFSHWDFNWKDQYPRWSINLILFQGKDVVNVQPGDDENQISIDFPKQQKKHSIAVGAALAVHFAYTPQRRNGLTGTREAYFISQYANISQRVCHCVT